MKKAAERVAPVQTEIISFLKIYIVRVSIEEINLQELTRSERKVKNLLIIFEMSEDFSRTGDLLTIR